MEPRKGAKAANRLIQDFIIPSLRSQRFGDNLMWDPVDSSVFMLRWVHKARASWCEEDAAVFLAWDAMKGRTIARTADDFVNSKQRLRAALRNVKTVEEVKGKEGYRRYRIIDMVGIVRSGCAVQVKVEPPDDGDQEEEGSSAITQNVSIEKEPCAPPRNKPCRVKAKNKKKSRSTDDEKLSTSPYLRSRKHVVYCEDSEDSKEDFFTCSKIYRNTRLNPKTEDSKELEIVENVRTENPSNVFQSNFNFYAEKSRETHSGKPSIGWQDRSLEQIPAENVSRPMKSINITDVEKGPESYYSVCSIKSDETHVKDSESQADGSNLVMIFKKFNKPQEEEITVASAKRSRRKIRKHKRKQNPSGCSMKQEQIGVTKTSLNPESNPSGCVQNTIAGNVSNSCLDSVKEKHSEKLIADQVVKPNGNEQVEFGVKEKRSEELMKSVDEAVRSDGNDVDEAVRSDGNEEEEDISLTGAESATEVIIPYQKKEEHYWFDDYKWDPAVEPLLFHDVVELSLPEILELQVEYCLEPNLLKDLGMEEWIRKDIAHNINCATRH